VLSHNRLEVVLQIENLDSSCISCRLGKQSWISDLVSLFEECPKIAIEGKAWCTESRLRDKFPHAQAAHGRDFQHSVRGVGIPH
jgi:hypothetical protein